MGDVPLTLPALLLRAAGTLQLLCGAGGAETKRKRERVLTAGTATEVRVRCPLLWLGVVRQC